MPKAYHDLTLMQRLALENAIQSQRENRKFLDRHYHHMTIESLVRHGLLRWTPLYGGSYQATEAAVKIIQLESTI